MNVLFVFLGGFSLKRARIFQEPSDAPFRSPARPCYAKGVERFLSWATEHWFTLVQSLGIVGSVLLTAAALRRDRKSRRIGDLLTISEQHHTLWSDMLHKPELSRVAASNVDLVQKPITVQEEEFLYLVIAHFFAWWLLTRETRIVSPKVLRIDAAAFFSLPLPKAVWERSRKTRDPQFVAFIEKGP